MGRLIQKSPINNEIISVSQFKKSEEVELNTIYDLILTGNYALLPQYQIDLIMEGRYL